MRVSLFIAACLVLDLRGETPGLSSPGPTKPPAPIHNRILHVPFGELDRILGKERKGILLDYDRYRELWALAESRASEASEVRPPVGAAVVSADYRGAVRDDQATFEASFKLRILASERSACPFAFQGVGLASVTLGDRGVSLFTDSQGRLALVTEGAPEQTAAASFSAPVLSQDASRSLRFKVPHAPAASLSLELPLKASIQSASAPYTLARNETAGTTTLRLALGGQTEVAVSWSLEESLGVQEPVILADNRLRLDVRPGALRLDAQVHLSILRAPIAELSLTLPESYDLVGHDVPHLKHVETVSREGTKEVRLAFHEPQKGVLDLQVSAEAGWPGSGNVAFPDLSVAGALRQSGKASIRMHESFQAKSAVTEGVRPVPDDPASLAGNDSPSLRPWRSFAFWQPRYHLSFEVSPLAGETDARLRSLFELREQQWFLTFWIRCHVKKGERLSLTFDLPQEWSLLDVTSEGKELEWQERPEGDSRRVEIALPAKLTAGSSFEFQARCKLLPEQWSSESWEKRDVPFPVVWVLDAAEQEGLLGVAADPQFELEDREVAGLESMDVRKLIEHGLSAEGMALGYSYRRRYTGIVAVTRRSPRVGATVTQYVQASPDVLRVHALVDYWIQYAATNELWLSLPEGTGRAVELQGADIREKSMTSREGESGETWRIRLHRKRMGRYPLTVSFEKKISGGESRLAIGGIRAPRIAREDGYLAIEASSDLEVHPTTRNLIDVDVSEIPPHPSYRPASRLIFAYRWLAHPVELTLDVIRHKEVPVLAMVIPRASYSSVVDENGLARTQAALTVKNASSSSLPVALPSGGRLWSVLVDGQPVKPAFSGGQLSIPLAAGLQGEKVLAVVLTYETSMGAMGSFGMLSFSGVSVKGIPILTTEWHLYLPERFQYLGHDGNMDVLSGPRTGTQFFAVRGPSFRWPFAGGFQRISASAGASLAMENNLLTIEKEDLMVPSASNREEPSKPFDIKKIEQRFKETAPSAAQEMPANEPVESPGSHPGAPAQEERDAGLAVKAEDTIAQARDVHSGRGREAAAGDYPQVSGGAGGVPVPRAPAEQKAPAGTVPGGSAGGMGTESQAFRLPQGQVPQGFSETTGELATRKAQKAKLSQQKLLSMEIQVPAFGLQQSFKRPGGDPEVRIPFVSLSFAHAANALALALAALLACWISTRWKIHPLFLLLVAGVLLLGFPPVVWEGSESFCTAALVGVGVYVAFRGIRWLQSRSEAHPHF